MTRQQTRGERRAPVSAIVSTLVAVSAAAFLTGIASCATPQISAAKRVLYVVGMQDEANIAAGEDAIVVVSGANRKHLEAELAKVNAADVRAVVSFGVAGALRRGIWPGATVVADRVVTKTGAHFDADPALTKRVHAERVTFLGTDTLELATPKDRREARRETGAAVVDMESHVAAEWAQDHQLPFAAVRTISDASNMTVPKAMQNAIELDGSIDMASVTNAVLADPIEIGALVSSSKDYAKALDALTRARRELQ